MSRLSKFLSGTCGCFERGTPKKGTSDRPGIYFWNNKGQSSGKNLLYVGGTERSISKRIKEHQKVGKYNPETHQVYSMPLKEGADKRTCVWRREYNKIVKYDPTTNIKKYLQRSK